VEELYDIIEEIFEEDGKGARNTIIMGDWNSVVGEHITTLLDHMDWEEGIREVRCSTEGKLYHNYGFVCEKTRRPGRHSHGRTMA
jgi:hypothetical protein